MPKILKSKTRYHHSNTFPITQENQHDIQQNYFMLKRHIA